MSVDRDFKVGIEADASSAIKATKDVADETQRYEAALRQMAITAKSAEQAEKKLTDESERDQQTLERVAQAQQEVNRATQASDRRMGEAEAKAAATARLLESKEKIAAIDKEIAEGVITVGKADIAAAEQSAGATAKLTHSKHQFREALRGLSNEFPIFGLAARLALNPLAGLIGGVVAGLSAFKRGMDDAIERMNTGVWKGSFRQSIEDIAQAAREGKLSLSAFQRSLDDIANSEQSLKDKTTAAIAAIHEQAAAQESLQDARKGLELARVNYQESTGKLSAPEAISKRFEIQERYQREAEMARFHAQEAELQAKRKHAEEVLKSAATTEKEAVTAKAEMDSAQQDWERYQKLIKGSKEALQGTNEQIKALTGSTFMTPSMRGQLRAAWDLRTQLQTRLDVMEPQGPAYEDQAAATRERWTQLSGSAVGLRREATEAARTLPVEEASARERYVTQGRTENLNKEARGYEAAIELARAVAEANTKQEQFIKDVAKQVERTGETARESAAAFRAQEDFNSAAADFLKRVQSQTSGLRNH